MNTQIKLKAGPPIAPIKEGPKAGEVITIADPSLEGGMTWRLLKDATIDEQGNIEMELVDEDSWQQERINRCHWS